MYLAGVSVRRVEDITEALWGTRVSSGTVSKFRKVKFGGLGVNEARRLKELEQENCRLKTALADVTLREQALKEALQRKW